MLEKIIAGMLIFCVTSIVAYAFKMRQLYAVVPKLHRKNFLSDGGSVAELVLYNKGTKVEEEVSLELRQELKCELLASNSSGASIQDNVIKIDRIHSHSEISLILLIEAKAFSHEDLVQISSKEKIGKLIKKVDEVPPSASRLAIGISLVVTFFCTLYWGGSVYGYLETKYIERKYSHLVESGWGGFERYLNSDLSESYSRQEFPVRFMGQNVTLDAITLSYEVINKSSIPIEIYLSDLKKFDSENNSLPFESVEVAPLDKDILIIQYPNTNQKNIEIRGSISFGEEYIHGLKHKVHVKDLAVQYPVNQKESKN